MLNKIIAIVGPTASGKTLLAIEIAKQFNGELISADSRQIYRGMDIGTAKEKDPPGVVKKDRSWAPTIKGIPQHLIDITDPDKPLTVSVWQEMAFLTIADILEHGKLPVIVGGTGLYVRSVVDAFNIPSVPPNPKLRRRLARETNTELFWQLKEFDPKAAAKVDRKNKRRLVRAIEVARAKVISGKRGLTNKEFPKYDILQIAIDMPRVELYNRIDKRVEKQFEHGLVKEVEKLLKKYDRTLLAMSGIGYRQIIEFLDGIKGLEETVQRVKFDTHAYARRQLTWFRKDKRINWVKNKKTAIEAVRRFLKKTAVTKTH